MIGRKNISNVPKVELCTMGTAKLKETEFSAIVKDVIKIFYELKKDIKVM